MLSGIQLALLISEREKHAKEDKMEKRNVVDHRRIKLDKIKSSDYIPFMGGRPKREKIISEDDSVNLSIALNTSNTIEEFLNQV